MGNLRDHLLAVREERGKLTPATVVDAARDPEHPLHARFEWDDTVAAEKYRHHQAHELIQIVKISRTRPDGEQREVRAFHAVRHEREYVYDPVEEIAADPVTRQILLREMERDWRTLKKRYEGVREFFELVRADVDAA